MLRGSGNQSPPAGNKQALCSRHSSKGRLNTQAGLQIGRSSLIHSRHSVQGERNLLISRNGDSPRQAAAPSCPVLRMTLDGRAHSLAVWSFSNQLQAHLLLGTGRYRQQCHPNRAGHSKGSFSSSNNRSSSPRSMIRGSRQARVSSTAIQKAYERYNSNSVLLLGKALDLRSFDLTLADDVPMPKP